MWTPLNAETLALQEADFLSQRLPAIRLKTSTAKPLHRRTFPGVGLAVLVVV